MTKVLISVLVILITMPATAGLFDAAQDLIDAQTRLEQDGLSKEQIKGITDRYFDEVASDVPTASTSDYLEAVRQFYELNGHNLDEAMTMAPGFLKYKALEGENDRLWKGHPRY